MRIFVTLLLALVTAATAFADFGALEKRVESLEKQVASLQAENQELRKSAVDFLAAELAKKERERARLIYRTQVLPLVKEMLKDFGSPGPKLPKEEEIETLIDAYRPYSELILSLGSVAKGL